MPAVCSATIRTLTFRRRLRPALLLGLALALGACDRQKAADPQAAGAEVKAAAGADATSGLRYHIDEAQAGSPLPQASVTDDKGRPATLAALSGKPMLVNLWATWCAPCVEELPTIEALAKDVGDKAVVMTLSQDIGDAAPVRAFLAERGVSHALAWHDPLNAVGLAYGGALPTTLIYDAQGREVARVSGPMDWTGPEARALLAKAGFPAG